MTELVEKGKTLKARGSINIMDYVENCGGRDNWIAEGAIQKSGTVPWKVRCDDPNPFWKEKNGEAAFTANLAINENMRQFIAERLNYVLQRRLQEPGVAELVDRVAVYNGPMVKHTGACICLSLTMSNEKAPFDWQAQTGGQFPKNCFECNCGRRWWCGNPEKAIWSEVADDGAWETLTKHNGTLAQPVGFLKGKVYLLPTLRGQGLIPLGGLMPIFAEKQY